VYYWPVKKNSGCKPGYAGQHIFMSMQIMAKFRGKVNQSLQLATKTQEILTIYYKENDNINN
jgi:hypothetical protein